MESEEILSAKSLFNFKDRKVSNEYMKVNRKGICYLI